MFVCTVVIVLSGCVLCWPSGWVLVESSVLVRRRRVMSGFLSGGAAVHVSNHDIGIFIDWSCVGAPWKIMD